MKTLLDEYLTPALLIALLVLFVAFGVQSLRLASVRTALTTEQRDRATERKAAADAALRVATEYRTEETRRNEARDANVQTARAETAVAVAASDALRVEHDSLRKQVAAYRRAAGNPVPVAGSPPAGDALDLLADLFGRATDEAEQLARYADAARIAGATCERQYDSLNLGK